MFTIDGGRGGGRGGGGVWEWWIVGVWGGMMEGELDERRRGMKEEV